MTHEHGAQQWVVGEVETDTYKKRFDIIPIRNQENLKIFVKNHIEPGTIIVADGWSGYRFLDNDETSVWENKVFNHGREILGWVYIAQVILNIYGIISNRK